eukprot:2120095-Pleurochrysis_carterae.AAC.1
MRAAQCVVQLRQIERVEAEVHPWNVCACAEPAESALVAALTGALADVAAFGSTGHGATVPNSLDNDSLELRSLRCQINRVVLDNRCTLTGLRARNTRVTRRRGRGWICLHEWRSLSRIAETILDKHCVAVVVNVLRTIRRYNAHERRTGVEVEGEPRIPRGSHIRRVLGVAGCPGPPKMRAPRHGDDGDDAHVGGRESDRVLPQRSAQLHLAALGSGGDAQQLHGCAAVACEALLRRIVGAERGARVGHLLRVEHRADGRARRGGRRGGRR